ncbi:MAG: arginine repressor [Candidatus Dormibacteria bacterium]
MASPDRLSRQSAILELLRSHPVQTQEQLAEELRDRRIRATQATISRDLRQLRVARVAAPDGPRYLPPSGGEDLPARLAALLATQLLSMEAAGAMVVLRTGAGGAQLVAAAIDALELPEVVGTVAGDDTIFVQARSAAQGRSLLHRLVEAQRRGRTYG